MRYPPCAAGAALMAALLISSGPAARAAPFAQTCDQVDVRTCRTVVVFGDTQDIADYETRGGGQFSRAPWLEAMVDWVIQNRAAENIDFVLHVGDITEHTWWLPMSPGCWNDCGAPNCHCPGEVAQEWQLFDAQFRRLEAAGIPYAIVPGNHENIRNGGGPLDGPGFSDYFPPDRLMGLRGFLESWNGVSSGCTATAWQFALGAHPVLVLALPDSSVNPISLVPPDGTTALDRCPGDDPDIDGWAMALIERPEHARKPVFLLHHRLLEADLARRPKWMNTVALRPERFAAAVSGHWSPSTFPFMPERNSRTGAPLWVFAPRVDWQDVALSEGTEPTAASTLAVIRFHVEGGRADRVEARAWSPYFQVEGGIADYEDDDGVPPIAYSIFHDRDSDGDGIADDLDLCPYLAGASGPDTDGDGRGDACECGDQDEDGRNTVLDLLAIKAAIFAPGLAGPLCDSNHDGACSVVDIVAANAEIYSSGNSSTCARQPVPGP